MLFREAVGPAEVVELDRPVQHTRGSAGTRTRGGVVTANAIQQCVDLPLRQGFTHASCSCVSAHHIDRRTAIERGAGTDSGCRKYCQAVSCQLSAVSCQLSALSSQLSALSSQLSALSSQLSA